MPGELRWQKYYMDASIKSSRLKFYAILEKPFGSAALIPPPHPAGDALQISPPSIPHGTKAMEVTSKFVTKEAPALVLGFRASPSLLSISSERALRWVRELEGPVKYVSVEGAEGGIFAALSGGLLYFLSRAGKPQWKYRIGPEVTALASSSAGQCAAVADEKGRVACIALDGKPLWSARLEFPARALRMAGDGSAALSLDQAGGVSLIAQGGRVLWRRAFPDGIRDFAATGTLSRTVVLTGHALHSLSFDGSELWTVDVPEGTSAVRMPEDGEGIYAIGPRTVARYFPGGKRQWLGDIDSHPPSSSVMPGPRLLLLPFQGGAAAVDKWGNLVLECPVPVACASASFAFYDGMGTIFSIGEAGGSTHLFILDVGPSLVDYLLRASRVLADECARAGQAAPMADRSFLDALNAASSSDLRGALASAELACRYYEEALSAIQKSADGVVTPEAMAAVEISAREALEKPLSSRKPSLTARCFCGASNPVFETERPFLNLCPKCGKLGLVR
ncbi:MAG: PQQ-binding-like beta-propeller repeat protein [Thermoplasmata archaeon]